MTSLLKNSIQTVLSSPATCMPVSRWLFVASTYDIQFTSHNGSPSHKKANNLKEKLKKLATYRWSKVMASFMGKSDLRDFLGNLLAIVDKCNHSCIKVFLFTITKCCSSLTNPTSSSTLKMTKQNVLCKYQSVLSHNYCL